ncbi:MAG: hypothetical protein HY034_01900 [Nitrospirae bacterium]|nr:hypothetical protein [Nitrospirota bacterium]
MPNLLLAALLILFLTGNAFAAQEMLKTSKVKVGEKAPLTEMLKKTNEEKKIIVLVILSNPMQCNHCDELMSLLEKEAEPYKNDAAFITAGGQDMIGSIDQETLELKRLYGFVTMGDAWTFIVDRQGILKKIYMGLYTREELEAALNEIIGRKE